MIDGKQIHKVKNSDPRTFDHVKVYAGDGFHPAADAEYMNLAWENMKGKAVYFLFSFILTWCYIYHIYFVYIYRI